MSVTKETTIWCDADECVEWTQQNTGSVAEARRLAARSGWVQRGGKDFCRGHAGRAR